MVEETGNAENGRNEAEKAAGDTTAGNPGNGNGELGQFLSFNFAGESGTLQAISGTWHNLGTGEIGTGSTTSAQLEYGFGDFDTNGNVVPSTAEDVNLAQTDSLTAKISFQAVQARHNDNFDCADLNEDDNTNPNPNDPEPEGPEGPVAGNGEWYLVSEDGGQVFTELGDESDTAISFISDGSNDYFAHWTKDVNYPLSGFSFSYDTKQDTGTIRPQVDNATFRLYIDLDGDTSNNSDVIEVVYEPYYNLNAYNALNPASMTVASWQTWKANSTYGKFWTPAGTNFGSVIGGAYATNYGLSQILTSYPSAKVVKISVGVGTYNPNYRVFVDNLVINGNPVSLKN